MTRFSTVLLFCAMGLILSGCVVASPDTDTYDDAAATTLGTAGSEVSTVEKLLTLLDEDKIMRPTVVAQLRYSETNLSGASDDFDSLNPPTSADPLQKRVSDLLSKAEDSVQEARIAVHRDQRSRYTSIAKNLSSLADTMNRVEKSVS
jgi:hypothetical protein